MTVEYLFNTLSESWLKASVILVLGLSIAAAFGKSSPEMRHRLWLPLLAIVLVTPLLLITFPRLGLIPSPAPTQTAPLQIQEGSEFVNFSPAQYETIVPSREAGNKGSGILQGLPDWRTTALLIWVTGVTVFLLRLITGLIQLNRVRKSAIRVPSFIRETTTRLADECALSKPVALAISSAVHSPFAWNFGTPTIALPLRSKTWTKEELEMVLRHELVHLKRHDSISALLVGMVTTLHWFNPLAWRVARHVSELREQICDRNVLAAGCDPQKYAGLLFHQARAKSAPYPFSATAMAKPGTLEKRVNMILKDTFPFNPADGAHPSISRRILTSIGATCLLAISAAVILLGFSPESAMGEETGNTKLTIHVYSEDAGKQQLGYELNGEEIKGEALAAALKKEAKKNPVLALVQAAPVSLGGLQETMNLAKEAGFSHFIFQKREVERSGGHGRLVSGPAGAESTRTIVVPKRAQDKKQIHITTRFVEEPSPLMKKLNTLILPSIELNETPLEDAIAFISQRSVELDSQTANVEEKGVNFVTKGPPKTESHFVSLSMKSVSIAQVIKIIAHQMKMEVRVDEHAVMLRYTGVPGGASHPLLGHDPEAEKQIKAKLKSIRIPSVEFADTPVRDALEFLTQRSIELDAKTADVDLKGVNIVAENASKELDQSISLKLNNIPLQDAIRYTTDLADMDFRVEGNAVIVFKRDKRQDSGGFGFEAGSGGAARK